MQPLEAIYKSIHPRIDAARQAIAEDVAHFRAWPKNSKLNEVNLTFHVGRLLRDAGYHVYLEASLGGPEDSGKRKSIDALALSRSGTEAIIIESKYLMPGKFSSLNGDVIRMEPKQILDPRNVLTGVTHWYGLLLAHSWHKEMQMGWDEAHFKNQRQNKITELAAFLQHAKRGSGSLYIEDGKPIYWMMWALAELPNN